MFLTLENAFLKSKESTFAQGISYFKSLPANKFLYSSRKSNPWYQSYWEKQFISTKALIVGLHLRCLDVALFKITALICNQLDQYSQQLGLRWKTQNSVKRWDSNLGR